MERLWLECAVRAALIVAAAAVVLSAMRVKAATAKHSIWAGVVAMMLLLPIWMAWGPEVSLRVLPPVAQSIADKATGPIEISLTRSVRSTPVDLKLAVLLGVYLTGAVLLLFRLGLGTVRSRRLVRDAVALDGVLTSSLCAVPVTVGLFHPRVIFPEHWRQWPQAQLQAVLMHESEHARRRHPLIQWLALLNRALFWFHPVAWWLEYHLSTLAEEACDNVVLARGCDPRAYSECLIDMARSVTRSGVRLNIAGLAMPGMSLPRRIRRILEGGSVPRVSRARMLSVCIACAISCTAIAAGTLDHAQPPNSSAERARIPRGSSSDEHPATKFVLNDLKIEGDVHDRDGVKDRVLKALKSQDYDNGQELTDEAAAGIRADFQERGYFQVVVHDPSSQPLGLTDGKQSMLVIVSITEGDQFRLGNITIQSAAPNHALSVSMATLRDQFHIRNGDLFNTNEIRQGLGRLRQLYVSRGYADASAEPNTEIDSSSHRVDLKIRISEGTHTR